MPSVSKTIRATDTAHLRSLVADAMHTLGPLCDLNHIDVSGIEMFTSLFEGTPFNGDVSLWDTTNARILSNMFRGSAFNGNVSRWNVTKVLKTDGMFLNCPFSGDLSVWNLNVYPSSIANMFDPQFQGVVPSVPNAPHRSTYAAMFGSLPVLSKYMRRTAFNTVHLAVCLEKETKPAEVSKKDYLWFKEVHSAALMLEMPPKEMRLYILSQYGQRQHAGQTMALPDLDNLLG